MKRIRMLEHDQESSRKPAKLAAAAMIILFLFVSGATIVHAATPAVIMQTSSQAAALHLSDFTGQWVRKVHGRNFLVLILKTTGDQVSGSLAHPSNFNEGGGDVEVKDATVVESGVVSGVLADGQLHFVTQLGTNSKDQDHHVMTLHGHNQASILFNSFTFMAPWKLERADASTKASVASSWPSQEPGLVSPEVAVVQRRLKEMVVEDQAADVPPYASFGTICEKHYSEVLAIYEKYGWPQTSVVGRQAASDYWLLAVHQTQYHLPFAQKALLSMHSAVEAGEASKANYALFYDAVAQAEGEPQHWGTKTVCKDGRRALYVVDDPDGLDQRRMISHFHPRTSI